MKLSPIFLVILLLAISLKTTASPLLHLDRWCRRPGQPCARIKRGVQIWKSELGASEPRDKQSLAFGLFNSRLPSSADPLMDHISRETSTAVS